MFQWIKHLLSGILFHGFQSGDRFVPQINFFKTLETSWFCDIHQRLWSYQCALQYSRSWKEGSACLDWYDPISDLRTSTTSKLSLDLPNGFDYTTHTCRTEGPGSAQGAIDDLFSTTAHDTTKSIYITYLLLHALTVSISNQVTSHICGQLETPIDNIIEVDNLNAAFAI